MSDAVQSCPRCGYDQSGLTGTWTTQCPLEGRCSECGLTFAWYDVFNSERLRVRGFVEHARGFWQTFRWSWRTFFGSLIALRFWRRVRLEHTPRPEKWFWYILCTAGFVWLLARLAWLGLWIQFLVRARTSPGIQYDRATIIERFSCRFWAVDWSKLYPTTNPPPEFSLWRAVPPAALAALAAAVMMPVVLWALPDTRARIKLRPVHVTRAGVFGALPVLAAIVVLSAVDLRDALRIWLSRTFVIDLLNALDIGRLWYEALSWADRYQPLLGLLAVLWLLWWWAEAIRTGFRADKWVRILVAQWIAALLAAAIIVLLHPQSQRYIWQWLA